MGGKSQDNSAMINEQKAQAEEARQKETARQGRLAQGLAGIKAAFEGAPTMGKRAGNFDWGNFNTATSGSGDAQTQALGAMFGSNFVNALKRNAGAGAAVGQQVQGLPAGYTVVQIPGATTSGTPAVIGEICEHQQRQPQWRRWQPPVPPSPGSNRQGPQPFVTVTNPSGGGRGEGNYFGDRGKIPPRSRRSQAPYNNSGGGRGEGGSGSPAFSPPTSDCWRRRAPPFPAPQARRHGASAAPTAGSTSPARRSGPRSNTTPASAAAASAILSSTSSARASSTTTCRRSPTSIRTPRTRPLMGWREPAR